MRRYHGVTRVATLGGPESGVVSEVGVRALRDHLSRYLEQVQAGRELVVTDHGRGIARLVPIDVGAPIDRMIADGLVTPARQRRRSTPLRTRCTVSSLAADERL